MRATMLIDTTKEFNDYLAAILHTSHTHDNICTTYYVKRGVSFCLPVSHIMQVCL